MRKNFYFIMSITFWLFMAIGFSDNWLFDTGQPSNSNPKFLIHAFFAFSWFTLLVVQTGLIRKSNTKTHMKIGLAGMVVFAGFLLSTFPMYGQEYLDQGYLDPLSTMIFLQLVFATILIIIGFAKRKTNSLIHKTHIIFGSFMMIQPALDRAVGHLFGEVGIHWLIIYLIIFGLFVWYYKKIKWQIAVGFLVWAGGLTNVLINMR